MLPYFCLVEASSPPCACVLSTCPSLCLTSLCLCSLHLPLPLPHLPVLVFSPLAPPSVIGSQSEHAQVLRSIYVCRTTQGINRDYPHTWAHTALCTLVCTLWVDGRLFKNIFFIHVLCLHSSISCLPVFFR